MKSTSEQVIQVHTIGAAPVSANTSESSLRRSGSLISLCQYRARKSSAHQAALATTGVTAPSTSLAARTTNTALTGVSLLALAILWPVAKLTGAFDGVDSEQRD